MREIQRLKLDVNTLKIEIEAYMELLRENPGVSDESYRVDCLAYAEQCESMRKRVQTLSAEIDALEQEMKGEAH